MGNPEAFFTNKYFDLFILQRCPLFPCLGTVIFITLLLCGLAHCWASNFNGIPSFYLAALCICIPLIAVLTLFSYQKLSRWCPLAVELLRNSESSITFSKVKRNWKLNSKTGCEDKASVWVTLETLQKPAPFARRSSNLLTTRNSKTGSLKTPFWLTICTTSTVTNTVCKPTTLADFGRSPLQIYEGTQWSAWNPLPLWLPSKAERKTL